VKYHITFTPKWLTASTKDCEFRKTPKLVPYKRVLTFLPNIQPIYSILKELVILGGNTKDYSEFTFLKFWTESSNFLISAIMFLFYGKNLYKQELSVYREEEKL